jgi:uncharacterized protein YktB (UPF0637 family)
VTGRSEEEYAEFMNAVRSAVDVVKGGRSDPNVLDVDPVEIDRGPGGVPREDALLEEVLRELRGLTARVLGIEHLVDPKEGVSRVASSIDGLRREVGERVEDLVNALDERLSRFGAGVNKELSAGLATATGETAQVLGQLGMLSAALRPDGDGPLGRVLAIQGEALQLLHAHTAGNDTRVAELATVLAQSYQELLGLRQAMQDVAQRTVDVTANVNEVSGQLAAVLDEQRSWIGGQLAAYHESLHTASTQRLDGLAGRFDALPQQMQPVFDSLAQRLVATETAAAERDAALHAQIAQRLELLGASAGERDAVLVAQVTELLVRANQSTDTDLEDIRSAMLSQHVALAEAVREVLAAQTQQQEQASTTLLESVAGRLETLPQQLSPVVESLGERLSPVVESLGQRLSSFDAAAAERDRSLAAQLEQLLGRLTESTDEELEGIRQGLFLQHAALAEAVREVLADQTQQQADAAATLLASVKEQQGQLQPIVDSLVQRLAARDAAAVERDTSLVTQMTDLLNRTGEATFTDLEDIRQALLLQHAALSEAMREVLATQTEQQEATATALLDAVQAAVGGVDEAATGGRLELLGAVTALRELVIATDTSLKDLASEVADTAARQNVDRNESIEGLRQDLLMQQGALAEAVREVLGAQTRQQEEAATALLATVQQQHDADMTALIAAVQERDEVANAALLAAVQGAVGVSGEVSRGGWDEILGAVGALRTLVTTTDESIQSLGGDLTTLANLAASQEGERAQTALALQQVIAEQASLAASVRETLESLSASQQGSTAELLGAIAQRQEEAAAALLAAQAQGQDETTAAVLAALTQQEASTVGLLTAQAQRQEQLAEALLEAQSQRQETGGVALLAALHERQDQAAAALITALQEQQRDVASELAAAVQARQDDTTDAVVAAVQSRQVENAAALLAAVSARQEESSEALLAAVDARQEEASAALLAAVQSAVGGSDEAATGGRLEVLGAVTALRNLVAATEESVRDLGTELADAVTRQDAGRQESIEELRQALVAQHASLSGAVREVLAAQSQRQDAAAAALLAAVQERDDASTAALVEVQQRYDETAQHLQAVMARIADEVQARFETETELRRADDEARRERETENRGALLDHQAALAAAVRDSLASAREAQANAHEDLVETVSAAVERLGTAALAGSEGDRARLAEAVEARLAALSTPLRDAMDDLAQRLEETDAARRADAAMVLAASHEDRAAIEAAQRTVVEEVRDLVSSAQSEDAAAREADEALRRDLLSSVLGDLAATRRELAQQHESLRSAVATSMAASVQDSMSGALDRIVQALDDESSERRNELTRLADELVARQATLRDELEERQQALREDLAAALREDSQARRREVAETRGEEVAQVRSELAVHNEVLSSALREFVAAQESAAAAIPAQVLGRVQQAIEADATARRAEVAAVANAVVALEASMRESAERAASEQQDWQPQVEQLRTDLRAAFAGLSRLVQERRDGELTAGQEALVALQAEAQRTLANIETAVWSTSTADSDARADSFRMVASGLEELANALSSIAVSQSELRHAVDELRSSDVEIRQVLRDVREAL